MKKIKALLRIWGLIYRDIYPVVCACGVTGEGIDKLIGLLANKKSALAGPSGAGKSTLLNRMQSIYTLETGKISKKTRRGKHTTRHVELFETDFGAFIYDTPGFTSFDVLEAQQDELHFLYPEMSPFIGSCKYDNCRHIKEPECSVRDAVNDGKIHESRYHSYVKQYKEIQEKSKY